MHIYMYMCVCYNDCTVISKRSSTSIGVAVKRRKDRKRNKNIHGKKKAKKSLWQEKWSKNIHT